jgi:hypothetical protein
LETGKGRDNYMGRVLGTEKTPGKPVTLLVVGFTAFVLWQFGICSDCRWFGLALCIPMMYWWHRMGKEDDK